MSALLSPRAEADLDDIWLYVARDSGSLEIANHFIDSITSRFILIAEFPNIGRNREHDFGAAVRTLAVGEFVIVYEVAESSTNILRVVHGKRELEHLFTR